MTRIHLVCNAHLDPVWLWQWEEGAAEALSTFRIAADFCEEFDGFVFNHNEALLYEWIEEYDPSLFELIRALVTAGKWQIMGGWYLQPDCNLPSGESLVRQILYGRRYFQDRFGARPTTAINFDPFGHSRGIVQILARSGFDSYVFCRPSPADLSLPAEEFTWVGFDGSKVIAHRAFEHYLSQPGKAADKIRSYLSALDDRNVGMVLWGIGNHGGGPSHEDLKQIAILQKELSENTSILHSDLTSYFGERAERDAAAARDVASGGAAGNRSSVADALPALDVPASVDAPLSDRLNLPVHADHLNPWGPGCYTSQIRIKQWHRRLEDLLYATEKMASQAALRGLLEYPHDELQDAGKDLMFCQFHDILPGSSIPAVEEASLMRLGRGIDTVSRVRARSLFAMVQRQPLPADGDIPIFAYNPHPFPVTQTFVVEFQPSGQNREGTFTNYVVSQNGEPVPAQIEKEASSVGVDWRKRMAFFATLPPSSLARFDCTPEVLPERPAITAAPSPDGTLTVRRAAYEATVDIRSGALTSYVCDGIEYVDGSAAQLCVLADSDDAWESRGRSFRSIQGAFRLATPSEAAEISGVRAPELEPVRVIEDGDVRTVIEAILVYEHSQAVITYSLPVEGAEVQIDVRVIWTQKRSMLKFGIPLAGDGSGSWVPYGQTAFGVQRLVADGDEAVAQRWVLATDSASGRALSIINDGTYGLSMEGRELRLSLLRSPAYSGLPVADGGPPVRQDRFTERMDQGERRFRFWLQGGPDADRRARVDREAIAHGECPMALMMYPSSPSIGSESPTSPTRPVVVLSDDVVQCVAIKATEDRTRYAIRLFEPTGVPRTTVLQIDSLDVQERVVLSAFEVATLVVGSDGTVKRSNLIEE